MIPAFLLGVYMSQAVVISSNPTLDVEVVAKVPLKDKDVFLCIDEFSTYHLLKENQLKFLDTKPARGVYQ